MRIHWVVVSVFVVLPACEFHCSKGGLSRKEVEKQIGEKLTAEAGAPVTVACPEIKLGEDNQCTATATGGKQFPVTVSGAKSLQWRAENITFGPKIAPLAVEHLRSKFAFELPKPSCPPVVAVGDKAACVAKPQGVEVQVSFEVKPNDVYITDITGVIASDKVEPWLATQAPENFRPATVDCGPRLRVSVPDSTFACSVASPGGEAVEVKVGVTSANGDVKILGIEPKAQ